MLEVVPAPADTVEPRPGSRADRLRYPLARDVLVAMAEHAGVCIHPLAMRRTDRWTGETSIFEVPCGARLESKCKPCAHRARRLRMRQITEGWHLTAEPTPPVEVASTEVQAMIRRRAEYTFARAQLDYVRMNSDERTTQTAELDRGIDEVDEWLAARHIRGGLAHPADRKTRKV